MKTPVAGLLGEDVDPFLAEIGVAQQTWVFFVVFFSFMVLQMFTAELQAGEFHEAMLL